METKETQRHPKPLVDATCLLGEKGCYENGKCHYIGNCEHKVLTNADRIRAMSDEDLAEFLNRVKEPCDCCQLAVVAGACTETLCDDAMMKWLKQPVEGE